MQRSQVLIFVLAVLSQSRAEFQSNCTTSNNRDGVCIPINACSMLYSCLQRPNMTPNIRSFFRQQHCGTANNGYPAVCCEIDYNPSTTSTTMNPCYPKVLPPLSNKFPLDCGCDTSLIRIFGGQYSYPDEHPWVVLIEYDTPRGLRTTCSGTLISNLYVITAAHCVEPRNLLSSWTVKSVRFGEYNTDTNPDCFEVSETAEQCLRPFISIPIEKIIIHEHYSNVYNGSDIALLKLSAPVKFSPIVKPICLPGTSDDPPSFVGAGWGRTETSRASNLKMKVELPLIPLDECQTEFTWYNVVLSHTQFCAGGEEGKDTCQGDSGGPLMAGVTDFQGSKRWTIFGIVSFGTGLCGEPGGQGVYTKVNSFINWIHKNMN